MKRLIIPVCLLAAALTLNAQTRNTTDTTVTRTVTVERDYKPIIQGATKQNQSPAIIQEEQTLNPVVYSTYSESLPVGFNVHALPAAKTTFSSQSPLQGMVDGALGHRNTHFAFGYRIAEKKRMSLDLFANHDAMWGRQTLSRSTLGLQLTRHFSACELYFGVNGNNEYYSRYGRYYSGDNQLSVAKASQMHPYDWQDSWLVNTQIGLRSRGNATVRYDLNTGYSAYILPNVATEHQVRTRLNAVWVLSDEHQAGLNAYVQNNFYQVSDSLGIAHSDYHNRHAFRLEPYYGYNGNRFRIHAGINFDFNLGAGHMMSGGDNISFAPSPNLSFDWFLMKEVIDLYGKANGTFGTSTLLEFMQTNRYMDYTACLTSDHVDDYTPVDAQLGFKIRPMATMLLDIYAGYAYQINQLLLVAPTTEFNSHNPQSYLGFYYSDWQRWKVGAQLQYHWRDILNIHLSGNYYHWICQRIEADAIPADVYDRPSWDAHLRVDVHIDSKWSLYSDNTFVGSRRAFTMLENGDTDATATLKPVISLNLGASYAVNRWLSTYIQLNNYLNRHNDLYYGYQSQGINFLLGVKYLF